MDSTSHQSSLSSTQKAIMMAVAEVGVNHPLFRAKTILQTLKQGAKVEWTLGNLYRGIFPNMWSMIPITTVQVNVKDWFTRTYDKPVLGAVLGGVTAAPIANISELILGHMPKRASFLATCRSFVQNKGWQKLLSGTLLTAKRDALFSLGYQVLPKTLEEFQVGRSLLPEEQVSFSSLIAAGIITSVASQPADTIRTKMHGEVARGFAPSYGAIMQKTLQEEGIWGYWKGGLPRGMRVGSAITLMATVAEQFETPTKKHAP